MRGRHRTQADLAGVLANIAAMEVRLRTALVDGETTGAIREALSASRTQAGEIEAALANEEAKRAAALAERSAAAAQAEAAKVMLRLEAFRADLRLPSAPDCLAGGGR